MIDSLGDALYFSRSRIPFPRGSSRASTYKHLGIYGYRRRVTRYDLPAAHPFYEGIDESMSIDQSTHSIFGVSKAASDLMAQEYGRQFGLKVAVFRPVTITGPAHRGSKLHGYLSHLVKCLVTGEEYVINGFKGKQVRDNIHVSDQISAFYKVYLNPKDCFGEVYNIGAGRFSHNSIVEAIEKDRG